jgi:hypothetical protein
VTLIGGEPPLEIPTPDIGDSWLYYECWLELEPQDNVAEHRPLPREHVLTGGEPPPWIDGGGTTLAPVIEAPTSIVQRTNATTQVVFLCGRAARFLYNITAPRLESIGGVPVIPANRKDHGEGFKSGVVLRLGLPTCVASWRLRYIVPVVQGAPPPGIFAPSPAVPGGSGFTTLTTSGPIQSSLTTGP